MLLLLLLLTRSLTFDMVWAAVLLISPPPSMLVADSLGCLALLAELLGGAPCVTEELLLTSAVLAMEAASSAAMAIPARVVGYCFI